MSTRKTQDLIIRTAVDLFNEHGTKAVSTNRIADECGISCGNLYYHFQAKEVIIQTIFQRINREMTENWFEDHLHPTMEHMYFMFARQIRMIWGYRFFYLELNALLQKDERLKMLFMDSRKKRIEEVTSFFTALVEVGLMNRPKPPVSLESIVRVTWLISDQWVPHLNMYDRIVEEETIGEGYQAIVQILQPYFTEKAIKQQQQMLNEYGNTLISGTDIFGKKYAPQRKDYPAGSSSRTLNADLS